MAGLDVDAALVTPCAAGAMRSTGTGMPEGRWGDSRGGHHALVLDRQRAGWPDLGGPPTCPSGAEPL